MSDSEHRSETEGTSNDSVPFRDQYPSGWLALTKNESVSRMIDALLDLPPYREFNQSELADMAGVSRQSVGRHIDLLVGLGIVEPVDGTNRYRFDPESPVSEALIGLDGAVSAAGEDSSA